MADANLPPQSDGGVPADRPTDTPNETPGIERNVDRLLDEVVDQALGRITDEGERELVRQGIGDMLRLTLTELAAEVGADVAGGPSSALGAPTVGDAAQRGIDVAKQVQNLGFVEFTAGLINGTFDAIIGATVKQMKAYAELVADLGKTLQQYRQETVSDARIDAHLADRYPDGEGGTSVRATYSYPDVPADTARGRPAVTGNQVLQQVVEALVAETRRGPAAHQLTREKLGLPETDTNVKTFTGVQVAMIRDSIAYTLAAVERNQLAEMVRQGMARIVIDRGELLTKLTFNVTSSEVEQRTASEFNRTQAGAWVRGGAWAGWGMIQGGGSWNHLKVNTVNESSFDSLTMSTEMIGQVKLNFKTDYFPAAEITPTT
jgi:hypothetical protein